MSKSLNLPSLSSPKPKKKKTYKKIISKNILKLTKHIPFSVEKI